MKKVLVTGASGFIGSNMVKYLLENTNFIIYGIDDYKNGIQNKQFILDLIVDNPKRFFFVPDDFVNFDFEFKKINYVYHFAALPSVQYSVEFPIETDFNNINKTVKLLKLCSDYNVEKFIFSSSSAIYGDTMIIPTPEHVSGSPKSPYALQKLSIEKYCKIWSDIYGLETICLRYFNVYGPNQYSNNAYASVICNWIKNIISNNNMRIDGDGLQKRSFTFVKDICMANLYFSNKKEKFNGKSINISSENSNTLMEVKEIICKILNKKPEIIFAPERAGDIKISEADVFCAKKLGFKAITTLGDGLLETIEWYKNKL